MSLRRAREREGQHRQATLAQRALPAALLSIAACTVFDGVTLPDANSSSSSASTSSGSSGEGGSSGTSSTSTSSGGGAGGAGGAGGGQPAGSTLYLPLDDAAVVCSRAFTCPFLAQSIAVSLGVPADDTNFSQCLTWLAGP